MRKIIIAAALALATAGALPAVAAADTRCINPQNNTGTGALVGAAGGAAAGSLLAGRHSRGEGAILGALGGAVLGGAIGHSQVRCPEGYYAYDDQTRQYYDNNGGVYAPPPPGPGYGPPPQAAYGPPPPPGAYDRGRGYDRGPGYAGGGADYYRGAPTTLRERFDWVQTRIDRSASRGRLDPRAADDARRDLSDIRRQYASMSRRDGGRLNGTDRQYIEDRLNRLAQNVRWDAASGY